MFKTLVACVGLVQLVRVDALPQASTSATSPPGVDTGVPSITLSTAVASPTGSSSQALPSQVALPPVQPWCPSEIFCAGDVRVVYLRFFFNHNEVMSARFCKRSISPDQSRVLPLRASRRSSKSHPTVRACAAYFPPKANPCVIAAPWAF